MPQQNGTLKMVVRKLKSKVYPHIKLKQRHNARYIPEQLLDTLAYAALTHDFTTNGAKCFKLINGEAPHPNTILYRIRKLKVEEVMEQFNNAFDAIYSEAKKQRMFDKPVTIAIDSHEWLYYGDENDPMITFTKYKQGTNKAYTFATVNVVEAGKRFTLLALPVAPFDGKEKILRTLIEYAKTKVKIGLVLMDRAFFNVACISTLEELGVRWLMPAVQNERIKKLVEENEAGSIIKYRMRSTSARKRLLRKEIQFNLLIVRSNKNPEKNVAFATNVEIDGRYAQDFCDNYSKRWGIETSYRCKEEFRVKTTSKNYSIRLFYFLFSVCLYNLWILTNLIADTIFKKKSRKLLITVKLLGILVTWNNFHRYYDKPWTLAFLQDDTN